MNNNEKSSKELTATDSLAAFRNIEELEAWGKRMAQSQFSSLKEGKDIVAAVLLGKELGLSPMVSLNNIYPINGKGTLSVHIMNALLQQRGVIVEIVRNYEPCVAFVLKGDDSKPALIDSNGKAVERIDGKAPEGTNVVFLREGFIDEKPMDHEVKGTKVINWKTIVRLKRKIKQPDGSYEPAIYEGSFSVNEAHAAGLFDKKGSAWKGYTRTMVFNRAFTNGSKIAGADIMFGMSESSEMADVNNLAYRQTEDGHTIIDVSEPVKNKDTSSIPDAEEVKEDGTFESNEENKNPSQETN